MWLGIAPSSYSAASQAAVMAVFTSARICSLLLSAHLVEFPAPAAATVVSTASGSFSRNHERYLKLDELVPLNRVMSGPNVANVCYDTAYMSARG